MKTVLAIMSISLSTFALSVTLKDGSSVSGDPICESKTTLVLKDGTSTVSLFKKMIASVDGESLEGKREYMVGDSALLKEKNELIIINGSPDSCTIRLRRSPEGTRFIEKKGGPNDTISFALVDGVYFETVRYWRSEGEYYSTGQPFSLESKCSSFARHEIQLKGFLGDKIPTLKGPKIEYERE